jgi:hypothetical protein
MYALFIEVFTCIKQVDFGSLFSMISFSFPSQLYDNLIDVHENLLFVSKIIDSVLK